MNTLSLNLKLGSRIFNVAGAVPRLPAPVPGLADQPDCQPLHGHDHRGCVQHGSGKHPPAHPQGDVHHPLRKSDLSW